MLKYIAVLITCSLLACVFGLGDVSPKKKAEQYIPSQTEINAQIKATAEIAEKAEQARQQAAKQKAINNLVSYLERKWKRPHNDIREAVELSFMLANIAPKMGRRLPSSFTASSTQPVAYKGWPQPMDVLAIMQVESKFDKNALDSVSGSTGLMQVNSSVHQVSQEALKAPVTNLSWAIHLLRTYRSMVKSDSQALVAYNQGPGAVPETCGDNRICETEYTQKVALAKQELQRHFRL